jgi:predicted O-methyltransferase YrrM
VTFELVEKHAEVARQNISAAGHGDKVEIIVGSAVEKVAAYTSNEAFDLAFIDADNESNAIYMREAKRLVRKGGVIVSLPSFSVLNLD